MILSPFAKNAPPNQHHTHKKYAQHNHKQEGKPKPGAVLFPRPQCLQTIASSCISYAQEGHFFRSAIPLKVHNYLKLLSRCVFNLSRVICHIHLEMESRVEIPSFRLDC
jgi:hypothetical protein